MNLPRTEAAAKTVDVTESETGQGWRAVRGALEEEILAKRYPAGERLPSEQEVANRFRVSRTTVRRALLALSQAGLIRIVNGSGSFATMRSHTYTVDSNSRFRDTLEGGGVHVARRCLSADTILADAVVANMLDIAPGTEVSRLSSVMSGDGVPLVLSTRYYPKAFCPDLVALYCSELSVTCVFEKLGLGTLDRVATKVSARLPTEEEASYLDMASNAAVLQIQSRGQIKGFGIMEYNCSVAPGFALDLNFRN
ncbi:GntR family transcriptional regulator [Bosea eneae]|uniref:GntR family transcriptional regulator n=1 Tax=Bosea eneae TaxID=151454 RepID=A0ABW0IY45_9HYPH